MFSGPGRRWQVVGSPAVVEVVDLGLACCAVECATAFATRTDLFREVAASEASESDSVRVVVVSGTVTDKLRSSLVALADDPGVRVISFGACANSGGPYWDSYSVTKGIDQVLPVNRYVPGCAPSPEALVAAIRDTVAG